MDIFIVASGKDIKLLRHFLLSYDLFAEFEGDIHLFIWKGDEYLIRLIDLPNNLKIHYKDDVPQLVEDDFRNQMYLKLMADRYASSEWIWTVDSDFLICQSLRIEDLFVGACPIWFYHPWTEIPEKVWRKSTETLLGQPVSLLFMDEPLYILNRKILAALRNDINLTEILLMNEAPSEFVTYGAYAFERYREYYHWVDSSGCKGDSLVYRVNQRPPTYMELDKNSSIKDIGKARIAVFWSHWDLTERKMMSFLVDAQTAGDARCREKFRVNSLYIKISPDNFKKQGPIIWDGCYLDGWVKKESAFSICSDSFGNLKIDLEVPGETAKLAPYVAICIDDREVRVPLVSPLTSISIPYESKNSGTKVNMTFEGGLSENGGIGRDLYARVRAFDVRERNMRPSANQSILPNDIPYGSILGINYSGMHDSAIAIVAPDGTPIFACALERVSRTKQDGRTPNALLDGLPWDRIAKVAVSTERSFVFPADGASKLLRVCLPSVRNTGLLHERPFHDFMESIPVEKVFVCHQMAHAASAFWASGFEDALCFTYDGGMSNSPWFGGLYQCNRMSGIKPLDQFSALHYAKVTSLYTFVTALLGFTPNKHEGKITGLAACGTPTDACRRLVHGWFEEDFLGIESTMDWCLKYDSDISPVLLVNEAKIRPYQMQASSFSREQLAATVQEFAESHILEILAKAKSLGFMAENICLAGGLFANVKINQRIAESGYEKLFVAPPMTDDGTALGAAWNFLSTGQNFHPEKLRSMYLGPSYTEAAIEEVLVSKGIKYLVPEDTADYVASLLAKGQVVAVFQGGMEFGPRSLGNRSILAQATKGDINQSLNLRLNRTEFMPFAPVSRIEEAEECYVDVGRVDHAAEFMTVTLNCTEAMKLACPAVVHVDGTARPQLVSKYSNPFIHAILTSYIGITNKPALVNTSFNIHEEPIVCSPQDAVRGFFEAGLDYLCFEGKYLISFEDNQDIAIRFMQDKTREPSQRIKSFMAVARAKDLRMAEMESDLLAKEVVINQLAAVAQNSENDKQLIQEQARALHAYERAYGGIGLLRPLARMLRRAYEVVRPRLGNLNQYAPRTLRASQLQTTPKLSAYPKISIATPSFRQGQYIERTMLSVLNQKYPNLEFYVQDGGSTDGTLEVLKKYGHVISGWNSEKDNGQSHAINMGLRRTTGEIMAWLNSDDLLMPGTLYAIADYFARHPDVDVVYGNRLLIDENDMEIGRWILPGHDAAALSWVDYVPQETMFWRRRIWDKVGGQVDESFRFAMDWDLLVKFRDAGARFAHIPSFLGAFRIHAHQKTSNAINEIGHSEMNRIRERTLGRIPKREEVRKAMTPYLLRHLFFDLLYRIKMRVGVKA